jgi:flagellar motor switch protein FliG
MQSAYSRSAAGRPLTRRRKAAMVVQLLLSDGQPLPLARLPEELQLDLTRELGSLKSIDRETLRAVAEEFARDIESIGLTAPDGVAGALAALSAHLSPGAAAKLRAEAAQTRGSDPWPQIIGLPNEDLVRLLQAESTEIGAIVLSKLPIPRAAELLGLLPGERARRITYGVSQTADVLPEAVARIGRGLAAEYCVKLPPAFISPPVQRVGAILNSSGAATRDSVLEGLGTTDPDFADQVRKAIFTFRDVSERLSPADVPKLVRAVDGALLVTAFAYAASLGGAEAEAAEFILGNMSQRMAENLREEIKERGKIKKVDGEFALSQIVSAIRERADTGEITLLEKEDPAD